MDVSSPQTILLHAIAFLLALAVARLLLARVPLDRAGAIVTIVALASYALFLATLSGLFRSVGGQ